MSKYIDDKDDANESLQLVDVYAYNTTVAPAEPGNMQNQAFTFTGLESGRYDVTYTIYDHRDGYATAISRITVAGEVAPVVPWTDIILSDGEVFTAPYDKARADLGGYGYQGVATELIQGEYFDIPLFNFDAAQFLCNGDDWQLPSLEQLLRLKERDVQSTDNWPAKAAAYWTRDEKSNGENATVNLNTGESGHQC